MAKSNAEADGVETGSIRFIPGSDVHRITSGQVVLDLQTAVKELVENALDAGSTNIAIHFKDYGSESIEVADNGTGLDPSNYASVALKHYTSKLASFSELSFVRTFGFRGEALSSLCALADVSITTSTQDTAPMGTVLKLDNNGTVVDDSKRAARQRGTSITITGLFKKLPVRRKELEKNLKREYNKAHNLLQAYALITKGVRWITTNIPKGGRKTPQFSVNSSSGDSYLLGNVTALFGAKVMRTLMPLTLDFTIASASRQSAPTDGSGNDVEAPRFVVEGLISKPSYGSGRTSSDRQFFYINGRPWDAGRVCRAFNEVYKSFNTNQLPFVIANFKIPTDSYDVNVSPDKRTIFLHEENRLIQKIKEGLEELFAPSRATFLLNGASHSLRSSATSEAQFRLAKLDESRTTTSELLEKPPAAGLNEHGVMSDGNHECVDEQGDLPVLTASSNRQYEALEYREDSITPPTGVEASSSPEPVYQLNKSVAENTSASEEVQSIEAESDVENDAEIIDTSNAYWSPSKRKRTDETTKRIRQTIMKNRAAGQTRLNLKMFAMPGSKVQDELEEPAARMDVGLNGETVLSSEEDEASSNSDLLLDAPNEAEAEMAAQTWTRGAAADDEISPVMQVDMAAIRSRLSVDVRARRDCISQRFEEASQRGKEQEQLDHAGILAQDEAQVERVLSRVMHKADFERMEVVGQFNLGFIIARRRSQAIDDTVMDDLFIVDQHASDEKINFEHLQLTTRIQSQDLIVPRNLELSSSDELVAIDHQETLSRNGFEISVSETGLPGTRIKLLSQPISKTTVFGVKDLEELLYLLRDVSPDSDSARAIRCSKARSMFASRACRKSIMIGTALTSSKMKAILRNMGKIEQPWNCPHGRPTMRHLTCLATQVQDDSDWSISGCEEDQLALARFIKRKLK